jgi:hypothetical protein
MCPMTAIDPDKVEEAILQNDELVQRILDSAEHCSAPITPTEFRAWLKASVTSSEASENLDEGRRDP